MKKLCHVPLLVLMVLSVAHAQEIHNANDLLRAMHDRYSATWYRTLSFTQKSTTYNPDGTTKVETWYEAAQLPGKLRIDIGTPSDGNGYLLVDGNVSFFQKGELKAARKQ